MEENIVNKILGLLYPLHSIGKVSVLTHLKPSNVVKKINQGCNPDLEKECKAIKWILDNKSFDFSKETGIRHRNEDIVIYVSNLAVIYEKFGIFELCKISPDMGKISSIVNKDEVIKYHVETPAGLAFLISFFRRFNMHDNEAEALQDGIEYFSNKPPASFERISNAFYWFQDNHHLDPYVFLNNGVDNGSWQKFNDYFRKLSNFINYKQ